MKALTPRVGRPFIAVHTNALTDAPLKMAGNAARALYVELLLLAASHGGKGEVTANARELQFTVQLDGGVSEMETALAALVDAGKLVLDGERYVLTEWDDTQADLTGSKTRAASSGPAQLKRYHAEGKHEGQPRENCPLCVDQDAKVEASPAVEAAPVVAVEHPQGAAPGGAEALRAQFIACFDDVFASVDNRLDGYRLLLTEAHGLAEANKGLSKDVRGYLLNAVLADALDHYLEDAITPRDYAACFKGAKALHERDGYFWWVLAAQEAASADLTGKRPVGWLKTTASRKRSEWLEGRAA